MKKIIIIILISVAVSGTATYLATRHFSGSKVEYITDTNVVTRYQTELERDTVVKWYEKIKYTKQDPEKIYVQSVDTVFIEKFREYDVILQVKKEKDVLRIRALNTAGKVIKELVYADIGRDFTISSVKNDVVIKKKKFYWSGLDLTLDYGLPLEQGIKLKDGSYKAGLQTGVSFLDKVELSLNTGYDFKEKDMVGGIRLKWNLFR